MEPLFMMARCDHENTLTNGDEVLVISIDKERNALIVEPIQSPVAKRVQTRLSEWQKAKTATIKVLTLQILNDRRSVIGSNDHNDKSIKRLFKNNGIVHARPIICTVKSDIYLITDDP